MIHARRATVAPTVVPEASAGFVLTPAVQSLVDRAMLYLDTGYPLHLSGPAGTGKTTLAFHLASRLGRPVTLVHGDDQFGTSDLVGRDNGLSKTRLVDNYIRGVVKTEERVQSVWQDGRLTRAVREGHTLIYDEFTRSRPEANNALLSVLEEGVLDLGSGGGDRSSGFVQVHPEFHVVFTSNPAEYAGTHSTADALLDRMITIRVGHHDAETEVAITAARSGVDRALAARIVATVRAVRQADPGGHRPSVRAAVAIARVMRRLGPTAGADHPMFPHVARDVLSLHLKRLGESEPGRGDRIFRQAIQHLTAVGGAT